MPKLSGVFENFPNLSQINYMDIQKWLKFRVEPHILEDFIGNRIIYPQSIPDTPQDMEIDLAILREVIKLNPGRFHDQLKMRLVIPQDFIARFRPLNALVWAFADVLPLKELTKIFVKDWAGNHVIGTIIKVVDKSDEVTITLNVQTFKLKKGSLTVIPFLTKEGSLIVNTTPLAVSGGEAGLFVDLRS